VRHSDRGDFAGPKACCWVSNVVMRSRSLLAVLYLVTVTTALACECSTPRFGERVLRDREIFVATAVHTYWWERPFWPLLERRHTYHLAVKENFRGYQSGKIRVFSGGCIPPRFEEGKDYLVYAFRTEQGLYVSECSGTKPLTSPGAKLEVELLRRWRAQPTGGILSGSIRRRPWDTDKRKIAVRLTRLADGAEIEPKTDPWGGHIFVGLKPGTYRIEVLTEQAVIGGRQRTIQVASAQYQSADFQVGLAGSISGYFIYDTGRPVDDYLFVDLVRLDGRVTATSGSYEHRFEFREIPPGRYYLRARLNHVGPDNRPRVVHPVFYTRESGAKQVVSVERGETIKDLKFVMRDPIMAR
jgi:hypothetical protein